MKKLLLFFVFLMGVAPCFGMDMGKRMKEESDGSKSWIFRNIVQPRQNALGSRRITERLYLRRTARNISNGMDWGNKKTYNGVTEFTTVAITIGLVWSLIRGSKWLYRKYSAPSNPVITTQTSTKKSNNIKTSTESVEESGGSSTSEEADNKEELQELKSYLKEKFPEQDILIDEKNDLAGLKEVIKNQFSNLGESLDNEDDLEAVRVIIENEIELQAFKVYLKDQFRNLNGAIDEKNNFEALKIFLIENNTENNEILGLVIPNLENMNNVEELKVAIEKEVFESELRAERERAERERAERERAESIGIDIASVGGSGILSIEDPTDNSNDLV